MTGGSQQRDKLLDLMSLSYQSVEAQGWSQKSRSGELVEFIRLLLEMLCVLQNYFFSQRYIYIQMFICLIND